MILDDQSDRHDSSVTNTIEDVGESPNRGTPIVSIGFKYRNESPLQTALRQSGKSAPGTATTISTDSTRARTAGRRSNSPKNSKRRFPSPPPVKHDIRLRPELNVNVDPPVSILNYMKKSNLQPHIKYDSSVILELLKDHEVAKAVNFELGENHLITKSFSDMKQSSLKQFQALNQYKYGISPVVKRELLQKTIVEDKLKTILKFDPTMVTPPLSAAVTPAATPGGHRNHSGFILEQSSQSSQLLFQPEELNGKSSPGKPSSPTPPVSASAEPFRHPLLRANMKPISFLPTDPTNIKKISAGIRNTISPGSRSRPATTNKMLGTSIDPEKKQIFVKEPLPRSENPKKNPLSEITASLTSSQSSRASSHQQPQRSASPPPGFIRLKVDAEANKTIDPLYTPATFRRPKPLGADETDFDADPNTARNTATNRSVITDPLLYQTERWLDSMVDHVPPIDKSISWDDDGHPKHLSLQLHPAAISDDLSVSSKGSKGSLSVASKIPKTPSTPGGKNRKKYGEFADQLVRSPPSHSKGFQERSLIADMKQQHHQQDYQAFRQHRAELESAAIIEKHTDKLVLDSRRNSTVNVASSGAVPTSSSAATTPNPATSLSNPTSRPSSSDNAVRKDPLDKNKFHCVHCLSRTAELWCTECLQAYCLQCWNRVSHHTALNMRPVTTIDPTDYPVRQKVPYHEKLKKSVTYADPDIIRPHSSLFGREDDPRIPKTAPSPKSYANSILFASYQSEADLDQVFHQVEDITDPRVGTQHKPATVPRDETSLFKYQDYPHHPVYLDGKGQVHSFHSERPPSTVRTPYGLSPPMSPFHPQSSDKVIIRTLSPPITYDAKLQPINQNAQRHYNPHFQSAVKPNFRYLSSAEYSREIQNLTKTEAHQSSKKSAPSSQQQPYHPGKGIHRVNSDHSASENKLQKLLARSGSEYFGSDKEITIRRDPYKFRKRPKVAFSVGGGGGSGNAVSIAFSSKPPATAKPLTGITKEMVPIDWKEGLFQTKKISPSKEKSIARAKVGNKSTSMPSLFEVPPRETNIFNGVAVYTVNYKK